MSQVIKNIKVSDLVLWTENPRDPIEGNVGNQDIVDMAIADKGRFWKLPELAESMGDYYDL